MQVAAGARGRLTLSPSAKGRFAGDFHPRLSPKPTMVASGKGSVVTITIDLTFIDVTDRCLGLGTLQAYNALKPQVNPAGGPAPAPHYGCELRLLEYTKGLPATWAVLIPKTMIDQDTNRNIPVVLFYRLTGAAYTNSDNVKLGEFTRYVGDPPAGEPFYASGNQQTWNAHPNCGWERQLAESKKAFIFVHPFPHGGGYGDLEGRRSRRSCPPSSTRSGRTARSDRRCRRVSAEPDGRCRLQFRRRRPVPDACPSAPTRTGSGNSTCSTRTDLPPTCRS
ncbi:MAG: hypothetical protein R2882_06005 [Gemmatimonadales bacterium]